MAQPVRPPGPHINLVLAAIGQMFPKQFPFDPLAFGLNIARQYGGIAHYAVGPLHVYQLAHPDFARQILVEEPEKYYKARLIKQAFGPFAGQGLLTSDGAVWKRQRKLIQPAFHRAQLEAYGTVMVNHALHMIDSFEDGALIDVLKRWPGSRWPSWCRPCLAPMSRGMPKRSAG
jgi:cytochrome P450